MKKFLAVILTIIIFVVSTVNIFAEAVRNENSDRIEISFKVGDDVLKINGRDVKVQKPYVINGTTLVPLRVITEAFGAEVIWNGEEESIILKYSGVTIKLVIGVQTAIVDGSEVPLDVIPVIVNDNTMVPLRFITENFGADVKYNNETMEITVVKEIAGSNSIKDFDLILKKTVKKKVGDSYYNWSMLLPKNLEITYRSFNGKTNEFGADDKAYFLTLSIRELENETVDSLLAEELEYASDYSLLSQEKLVDDEQQYIRVAYRSDKSVYEDRIYINDGMIYELWLYVKDYEIYKENNEYKELLDSFTLDYVHDGSIEDLSDVNDRGYRTYEDKRLKWSIDVKANWDVEVNRDKLNEIAFKDYSQSKGPFDNSIYVRMYSIEDGLTLEKWLENEKKEINENLNPELVKVLSINDGEINDRQCKSILLKINCNNNVIYSRSYYITGQNYRYEISYDINSETYDNTLLKGAYEKAIKSFNFEEPDQDEIGKLLDPKQIKMSEGVRKIVSKEGKLSIEIPDNWIAGQSNDDNKVISYVNKDYGMYCTLAVASNVTFDQVTSYYENEILKAAALGGNFKNDNIEIKADKGTTVKIYSNTLILNDIVIKEKYYIMEKDAKIYTMSLLISDLFTSEKNSQILDSIWQSIKFE